MKIGGLICGQYQSRNGLMVHNFRTAQSILECLNITLHTAHSLRIFV